MFGICSHRRGRSSRCARELRRYNRRLCIYLALNITRRPRKKRKRSRRNRIQCPREYRRSGKGSRITRHLCIYLVLDIASCPRKKRKGSCRYRIQIINEIHITNRNRIRFVQRRGYFDDVQPRHPIIYTFNYFNPDNRRCNKPNIDIWYMSIYTLKRKTDASYRTMSTGQVCFSLNGGHRSQGYVGQTSLSRSLPRTLMHGDTARGSSACCGKYISVPIVSSGILDMNISTTTKKSVVSSRGRIVKRYPWILGGASTETGVERGWVKPDTSHSLNTQNTYVDTRRNATLAAEENPECQFYDVSYSDEMCNLFSVPSVTGAISQADYILSSKARRRAPCGTLVPTDRFVNPFATMPFTCANVQ